MLKYVLIGGGLVAAVAARALFIASANVLRGLYVHKYQVPGIVLRLTSCVLLVMVKYVARGRKPRFAEWTLEAEVTQGVLRCISAHYAQHIVQPENAEYVRRAAESAVKERSDATARAAGVAVQYFSFNGLEHLWLRGQDATTNKTKHRVVVLYFHGGGYIVGCPGTYITMTGFMQKRIRALLTEALGHDVSVEFLLANYRKAPQFPYPRSPQDAYTMYKYVLEQEKLAPHQIIVMGDSAGGGLSMTTLLRARDENPALVPAAAILSSPFVDREFIGDDRDSPYCLITAKGVEVFWNAYHDGQGGPASWGDASPVHCDLRGLPPVYIQATEFDYLLPHAKRLYANAVKAGLSTWTLEVVPNVPHAYTSLGNLAAWPTATQSLNVMSDFAATQFARAASAMNGNGQAHK